MFQDDSSLHRVPVDDEISLGQVDADIPGVEFLLTDHGKVLRHMDLNCFLHSLTKSPHGFLLDQSCPSRDIGLLPPARGQCQSNPFQRIS